ncbi:HEPN domain-containing protein [Aquibaculum sediminis]|uniref:HEPN domain-containing protein n=1 Tax=Aquibaculum sediminis TaxID=3231907 RepID=UPI0034544518
MMNAEFFDILESIKGVTAEEILVDASLGSSKHNTSARILRHGLSVSSFALLEKYLQGAFHAFMEDASKTKIAYADMSEDFRKFVTIYATEGILNRMSFMPKADRLSFFESEISFLPNAMTLPARFNAHGFSPKGSNISKDDIASALKALGVHTPWSKLTAITGELGAHRTDLGDDFENLARTRHSSAHNPTGNVTTTDLETNLTVSALIALSVALLLHSLKKIYIKSHTAKKLREEAKNPPIKVRFVDKTFDGAWIERKRSTGKAVKRHSSYEKALRASQLRRDDSPIVVRNSSGIPLRIVLQGFS